jgi:CheY-like chemotaxis protein
MQVLPKIAVFSILHPVDAGSLSDRLLVSRPLPQRSLARQCKANPSRQSILSPPAPCESKMPKRTVLVVDDNLDFAEGIAKLLQSYGQPAIAIATVRGALDTLDDDPTIGLVVSDIRMPSVDGFDFHRVLKYRFASLPVVLMTGLPLTEEDNPPRDIRILRKPFPIEELLQAIAEHLGG